MARRWISVIYIYLLGQVYYDMVLVEIICFNYKAHQEDPSSIVEMLVMKALKLFFRV